MAGGISPETYFEVGLDALAELGYGGLKLAEVCSRLGVTTGSFYHYFANWSAYTRGLIEYWLQERTLRLVETLRAEPDPRLRIDGLIQVGLTLPHGAEAAIRAWSSTDADIHVIQIEVDQQRFDILYESAFEILQSKRPAQLFADWAMYLLIGYEQSTLPRDEDALSWIADQLLDALDAGRFAGAPHG